MEYPSDRTARGVACDDWLVWSRCAWLPALRHSGVRVRRGSKIARPRARQPGCDVDSGMRGRQRPHRPTRRHAVAAGDWVEWDGGYRGSSPGMDKVDRPDDGTVWIAVDFSARPTADRRESVCRFDTFLLAPLRP